MKMHNITAPFDKLIFASDREVHEVMYFLANNDLQFKVLLGSYKGQRETSFIVEAEAYVLLREAGLLDEQESILFVGQLIPGQRGRSAHMLDLDTLEFTLLGNLVPVPRIIAERADGYSYDPTGDHWFTIELNNN